MTEPRTLIEKIERLKDRLGHKPEDDRILIFIVEMCRQTRFPASEILRTLWRRALTSTAPRWERLKEGSSYQYRYLNAKSARFYEPVGKSILVRSKM